MADLYHTLGVNRSASAAEIKSAYRKLAKQLHPDRNKDKPRIAERFKMVSAAYHILSDEKNRARYDRGEIDDNGNERATFGAGSHGGGQQGGAPFGFDMGDAEDLFSQFFGFGGNRGPGGGPAGAGSRTHRTGQSKGMDVTYELTVGFEEAAKGGTRRITLNTGKSIDIKIPEGTRDGQTIRLAGQGGDGIGGGKSGDALVRVKVSSHPWFKRRGQDIHLEVPISVDEAVLGGQISVPTLNGKLTLKIPAGSSSGKRLRLRGKGIATPRGQGDMYISLKIMMPAKKDPDLVALMKQWHGGNGDELRKDAGFDG